MDFRNIILLKSFLINLKIRKFFALNIHALKDCSNCIPDKKYEKYLSQILNYDNNYINMFQIEDLINNYIKNYNSFVINVDIWMIK